MPTVQFDDAAVSESKATELSPISPLRKLLLESVKALASLRDTDSIREMILSVIFSITPANVAAIVVHDSVSGKQRDGSDEPIRLSRALMEQARKGGSGILWNDPPNSVIC